MRLRFWVVLLLKGEVGGGEAFDIRQMPACSRPLTVGALQMEGGGGVTFLKLAFASPSRPKSTQQFISDQPHHKKIPSCKITSNTQKATSAQRKLYCNHGGYTRRAHHAVCRTYRHLARQGKTNLS